MKHRSLSQALQEMATAGRLRALLWIAAAVPLLMLIALAWYEHRRTVGNAMNGLRHTTRVMHEHATKMLETNEAVLDRILDLLGNASTESLSKDEKGMHMLFAQATSRFDQIRNVILWDESGRPIASSRYYPLPRDVSIADRPFFIRHKSDAVRFSINDPIDGRLSGDRIFNVSKRRSYADGRFGGVVTLALSPQYFTDFFRRVLGDESPLAITLLGENGEIVSRYPTLAPAERLDPAHGLIAAIRSGAEQGILRAVRGPDGQARYVAFYKVSRYGLYVLVCRTRASVLAESLQDVAVAAFLVLPGGLVLMFAIWLAWKRTESEHRVILRFHDEEVKRRGTEDQLRQLQKFEAIGQLTSGLAHDFNNLLHIIATNISILAIMPASMDRTRHVGAINHAVTTGHSLITHLLAFARRKTLTLERLDPASALPDMCELARHSLPAGITLDCRIERKVWEVEADRSELELTIINTVLNARDAMPGGGRITVIVSNVAAQDPDRMEAHLPEGEFVAFSVRDTGTGIPDSMLHRVFEPFFTTKQEKGSGLGLSRLYSYALQLGGTAVARNAPEGGAVIELYIPRAAPSGEGAAEAGVGMGIRALNTAPTSSLTACATDTARNGP